MVNNPELLGYREPSDHLLPGVWPVVVLSLVPLLNLIAILTFAAGRDSVVFVVLVLSACCPLAAFRKYARGPHPWYVIVCLTVNAVAAFLLLTPVGWVCALALATRLGL
jgi:hypothetical protein